MSEKWKQKTLLIFPFAVLAAGMILTAAFFLHTYRQIAFEHTSALCETILENSPEAEPQLLAALKDYHSLTEQELRDKQVSCPEVILDWYTSHHKGSLGSKHSHLG